MSELSEIFWYYNSAEDLAYIMQTGIRRQVNRVADGSDRNNRRVENINPYYANQLGVKGEYAMAMAAGLPLPTAGKADPGYDFVLGKWRGDAKCNGRNRKDLLIRQDRPGAEPDPSRVDFLLVTCTPSLDDPWVGIVGWVAIDTYKARRQFHKLTVDGHDGGEKLVIPTWVVLQKDLNSLDTLPGWPHRKAAAPKPPPYQSPPADQKRLL